LYWKNGKRLESRHFAKKLLELYPNYLRMMTKQPVVQLIEHSLLLASAYDDKKRRR
jgi:predicted SprT family Zn-dependent metalloprotease